MDLDSRIYSGSSDMWDIASEVLLGSFLGALLGYMAQWAFDARKSKRIRTVLGSTLRAEVNQVGDPIGVLGESGSVDHCSFPTLEVLLSSGAVDPRREDDLLTHMVFLQSTVNRFNAAVDLYNQAKLANLPASKITAYWHDLCGAADDLYRAAREMNRIGDRLGPLPELIDESIPVEEKYKRRYSRLPLHEKIRRKLK